MNTHLAKPQPLPQQPKLQPTTLSNLITIYHQTPKNIIGRTSYNKIQLFVQKPDCQRSIDDDHVNELYTFETNHFKKHGEFFFPKPIIIGFLKNNFYVMDGQHRLACLKYLVSKYKKDIELNVSILILENECELDEKFLAINQNTPVPILSNDIDGWKNFNKFIEEYLKTNFGKFIKKSNNPNSPNFNIKNLFEYMKKHRVAQRLKNDYKTFLRELECLNIYYRQTYMESIVQHTSTTNILKKIVKSKLVQPQNPLFVTLFKHFEWVNRIVHKMETGIGYENMVHVDSHYRERIKKKLKRAVWSKHFDNSLIGNCYVCVDSLNYDNFECGHVQSVFYGGKTNLANLEPICKTCNRDMGIQNLEEYKTQIENEFSDPKKQKLKTQVVKTEW